MNFQRGREKEPLEINLVPLIDVMMVILIFLMITTTYNKYTELAINLPSADAEKQPDRSNEIAVLNDMGTTMAMGRSRNRATRSARLSPIADPARRTGCRRRG